MSTADSIAIHTRPDERPDWQQVAERWRVRENVPKGWLKCVPIVRVPARSARAQ